MDKEVMRIAVGLVSGVVVFGYIFASLSIF